MYTGIKHLHSTLAYVLLLGLIVSIVFVLIAYFNNKPYNRKMALLGLICAHLQLVVGFIAYAVSPYGFSRLSSPGVMSDGISRLYAIEHPLMMLVAIILITVGYSRAKRMTAPKKQNASVLIFYGIGLLLILSRIPWHTWPAF